MNKPFASRKLQIELLSKKDGNWKMYSIPVNKFARQKRGSKELDFVSPLRHLSVNKIPQTCSKQKAHSINIYRKAVIQLTSCAM